KNYDVTWNNTTKELKIENFDASSGIDLLHSPLTGLDGSEPEISGRPLVMNFNHILTNVNVELVKAAENSNHIIRITQVAISGLCTKGNYSWTKENAQWDTDGSSTYISKEIDNIFLNVKSDDASDNYGYTSILRDVLCIPQDINENSIYLVVAYDFKQDDATADYITGNSMIVALPTTYNWGIGEKVTYRATIDAHMNLEFGTPGIEAWVEEPESGTIIIK
ncbi:MAG: fimbrillin family protein, partial [Bacteroidaceae bacterium]|nr:fimbrillin family protein [Bacteroidaceae bacterium]